MSRARSRVVLLSSALVLVTGSLVGNGTATARVASDAWGPPTQLASTGVFAHAATTGDAAVVAWTDDGSVFAGYRPPGGEWETAELGEGSRPRVAVNAAGAAVVAWHRSSDGGSAIEVSQRPAEGPWTEPTTVSSAGRLPVASINEAGTVRVLALRWGASAPKQTDVELYTFTDDWSPGLVVNHRPLENTGALQRSLSLTTDSGGRMVAGWLCRARYLFAPGDPRADGWLCLRYPGSRAELIERVRTGRYAVSAPTKLPIYAATPFAVSDAEPGMVGTQSWDSGGDKVARISLDVARNGNGVVSWQVAGTGRPLWVAVVREAFLWRNAFSVVRHTHGPAGATYAEPDTALVFWRTAGGELRTASKTGKGQWKRDAERLGQGVERADLVSNRSGDALLAWSSSGDAPGVYVTARPAAGR